MQNKKLFKRLGKYLDKCRQNAGVTQAALAKQLGYSSPQFCSNCARGLCKYPDSTLKQVVKLTGADKGVVFDIILKATREHYGKLLVIK